MVIISKLTEIRFFGERKRTDEVFFHTKNEERRLNFQDILHLSPKKK